MPKKDILFAQTSYLPDRIASAITLPPEVITNMTNWKLREGVASVVPGYFNPITAFTSTSSLTGEPYFATNLNFTAAAEILYLSDNSTDTRFYKAVNTSDAVTSTVQTLNNNSATFSTGDKHKWQSFDWGEATILNHPTYAPMYATAGGSNNDLTGLTNWDTADRTSYLFPYGSFMVGLGFKGATPGGQSIDSNRVIITSSRITTFNELPKWELGVDDGSTSAIYLIDGLADGDLIAGGLINNSAVVYTNVGSISLGDQGDGTISLEALFTDVGIISSRAFCNVPNGHFVIGGNQVYTHDNSSKIVLGEEQWSDEFFSRIDASKLEEIQCTYNSRDNTVWVKIPTVDDTEIWVVNLATRLVETVYSQQSELNYLFFTTEGLPFSTLSGSNIPFPTAPELYPGAARAFSNRMIAMGGSSGSSSFFVHQLGTDFGGTTINAVLERGQIKPTDGYSQTQIMRAVPYYTGTGSVTMEFGGSEEIGDVATYPVSKVMTRGTDTKFDMRFTRRYLSYRFTSSSSGLALAGFNIEESEKYKR